MTMKLLIDVQQNRFLWAIVDGSWVRLESGSRVDVEALRGIQLDRKIEVVWIDAGYRRSEVLAACAEYGWTPMQGRACAAELVVIEEATKGL